MGRRPALQLCQLDAEHDILADMPVSLILFYVAAASPCAHVFEGRETCAMSADVTMPCGEAAPSGRQQARMGALREALDKARRAQKPLIISRLHSTDAAASSQKSARTDCLYGDPALLAALQPIVRPVCSCCIMFCTKLYLIVPF